MADFLIAYKKVRTNEGGYANHPNDRGGETWKGIARKFHPKWPGWKVVDEYRKKSGFPGNLNSAPGLQDLVLSFYKTQFWDKMKGDQIDHQEIATDIFDSVVNVGIVPGIRMAQNAAFGLPVAEPDRSFRIKDLGINYGVLDNITLNKLNNK